MDIALDQIGKYEQVQFQVASLFAGRSSEAIEEENEREDENSEKSRKNVSQGDNSIKNTIKSRKAF